MIPRTIPFNVLAAASTFITACGFPANVCAQDAADGAATATALAGNRPGDAAEGAAPAIVQLMEEHIRSAEEGPEPGRDPRTAALLKSVLAQVEALELALETGDFDSVSGQVSAMERLTVPAELIREFRNYVASASERATAMRAAILVQRSREIDDLTREFLAAIQGADHDPDLEPFLIRLLGHEGRGRGGGDRMTQRIQRKAEALGHAVTAWMDFLAFEAAGNVEAAQAALVALRDNRAVLPVVPRPFIEERMAAPPASAEEIASECLGAIGGVGDLAAALTRVREQSAQADHRVASELRVTIGELEELAGAAQAAEEGRYLDAFHAATAKLHMNSRAIGLGEVRKILVRKLLPPLVAQTVGRDPGTEPAVGKGVGELDYLLGHLQATADGGDFEVALTLLEGYERLLPFEERKQWVTRDRAGLESFLLARRYEDAGDRLWALLKYGEVTETLGGRFTPVELAQQRLAELRAEVEAPDETTNERLAYELRMLRRDLTALRRLRVIR